MVRLQLTREKLREFGVSEAEIDRMLREGVRLASDNGEDGGSSKYQNKWCRDEFFGTDETFQSLWERTIWYKRKTEELAGQIRNLRRQVRFPISMLGIDGHIHHIWDYVADFVYEECRGEAGLAVWHEVIEDTKGHVTREYRAKKLMMKAVYGISIRETYQDEGRNRR